MKKEEFVGMQFGEWTVIGESDKPQCVRCRCSCGAVQDVRKPSLKTGKSKSCRKCASIRAGPERSTAFLEKRKRDYIGKVFNGWTITDVYKNPAAKNNDLFCTAICPTCGKKYDLRLTNVRKVKQCRKCTNNVKIAASTIHKETDVDGSSLVSIKARVDGKVNRNSSTGYNGVFKDRARYRAVICFRGRKTYLGSYSTIEEAVAARKEAEDLIYAPYLKEHEGWENELTEKLAELKKSKK